MISFVHSTHLPLMAALILATGLSACTGQIPGTFRLRQAEETFGSDNTIDVNTKIDMLWVIDNSASMDVSQQRLRDGFRSFAQKYMKPTWDIRVAVITTDTYLAGAGFTTYLTSQYEGTNYKSNYLAMVTSGGIPGRSSAFVNPSWAPTLVNLTTPGTASYGRFTLGSKVNENWPQLGADWAKLLPGNHDGPMITLCYEHNYYFFKGVANCRIRDDQTGNTGVSHCVNPGSGEDSVTQCANTSMNNTVHSGKAIIETQPPTGTLPDQAWTDQLISDFLVNLSTGASGNGSERPLSSVIQLIQDNEAPGSATAFFRPGSLRVITFVTDEEDQSTQIPSTIPSGFGPYYYNTSTCASKTVDGYTYTVSNCPQSGTILPVDGAGGFKAQLDTFFSSLDATAEDPSPSPNYFVVSIVALTGQSLQQLHAERAASETQVFGSPQGTSCDRADRLMQLGSLVGNGSLNMDIASTDYTPLLDAIGQVVLEKKASYTLARAPASDEEILFVIKHADGSATVVPSSQYSLSGKVVTITDNSVILGLASTDKIAITYQPKSIF